MITEAEIRRTALEVKRRRVRELASLLSDASREARPSLSLFSVMPDFEAKGSHVRCNWSPDLKVNLAVISMALVLNEQRYYPLSEYSAADFGHYRCALESMQRLVVYAA